MNVDKCKYKEQYSNGETFCSHPNNYTPDCNSKVCPIPKFKTESEYIDRYGVKLNENEACPKCGSMLHMYVNNTKAFHCGTCYFLKTWNE